MHGNRLNMRQQPVISHLHDEEEEETSRAAAAAAAAEAIVQADSHGPATTSPLPSLLLSGVTTNVTSAGNRHEQPPVSCQPP